MRMCLIVICGMSGSAISFHIISHKRHDFLNKIIEHKMCFDFVYNFVRKIFHFKKNWVTYRVWRYRMLYNIIWPPDDGHNSVRNM